MSFLSKFKKDGNSVTVPLGVNAENATVILEKTKNINPPIQ
jgi:hypothetical protein